jgi:1-acyl-sn-glycerol-3-phosphate acyltransferase
MLAAFITRLVGWAVALFYDVERTGPRLAGGPVLVVANHPNALADPVVIFHTAGRVTRPLAKAPLFEQALVGTVLKGLGGLPVYRRQDDPELMHLNERTFDAAIEALRGGGAVQIYPEGQSHSAPSMTPLRTGAARIALQAEARAEWGLGLRIQPVGLTYHRKHAFRGRAIAVYGEPFDIAPWREAYEIDERAAVAGLTDEIRRRLEAHTLNFDEARDAELVDVAERLYARARGLAGARERARMADRLPRLQRFAAGLRELQDTDPKRLDRLRDDVSRYLRLLTLYGVTEGDVPERYGSGAVARYVALQTVMLLLVLPAAFLGALFWAVPFFVTRRLAYSYEPKLDQVATYKVGGALVCFPVWLAATCAVVWLAGGWVAALVVALVGPVVGLATVAWREREGVVREDVRVFLRSRRRSQSRDRLAELRNELAAEFDAIVSEGRQRGAGASGTAG